MIKKQPLFNGLLKKELSNLAVFDKLPKKEILLWPEEIIVKKQTRETFEEKKLEELSWNILTVGLIYPLLVHKTNEGYVLIAGERRYRSGMIYLKKTDTREQFPCYLYENLDDRSFYFLQLAENFHVEVPPAEEAKTIKRLWDMGKKLDPKMTLKEFCIESGLTDEKVRNAIRFIGNLDETVASLVYERKLSYGTAVMIARITDPELQRFVAVKIISLGLSTMDAEKFIRFHLKEQGGQQKIEDFLTPEIEAAQFSLALDKKIIQEGTNALLYFSYLESLAEKGLLPKKVLTPRAIERILNATNTHEFFKKWLKT